MGYKKCKKGHNTLINVKGANAMEVLMKEYEERKQNGEKFTVDSVPVTDIFLMYVFEDVINCRLSALFNMNEFEFAKWRNKQGIMLSGQRCYEFTIPRMNELVKRIVEKDIDISHKILAYALDDFKTAYEDLKQEKLIHQADNQKTLPPH